MVAVMALNLWKPAELKPGDYVRIHAQDTEAERAEATEIMRQQGCKSVRFETLDDGRLQVHGYLQS